MKKIFLKKFPMSLDKIIYLCVKKKCNFIDLDPLEKECVLSFLKEHSIDIKIFERKGFNILKQNFFVKEYYFCEEKDYKLRINEFETFNEYYDYLCGDIFDNACYFGYIFTDNDNKRIGKTNNILNKISYSKDVIDNYSYEKIKLSLVKDNALAIKHCKKMKEWFNNCSLINSYSDLLKQLSNFKKKFKNDNVKIFFTYIFIKNGKNIKDYIIKFACSCENFGDVTFQDILDFFGVDAAKSFVDNYSSLYYSQDTIRRNKKRFNNVLNLFSSDSKIIIKTKGSFDEKNQLYIVTKIFYKNEEVILLNNWQFLTFEDFAKFLNNDLTNCNLNNTNLLDVDFSKFKINETTKLPKKTYDSYSIKKWFNKDKFYVEQLWLDNEGNKLEDKLNSFSYFCDFFYFVHGDLSNADLIMCEGIENIKTIPNVKYDGIKVCSFAAQKLGLKMDYIPSKFKPYKTYSCIELNENETTKEYLEKHLELDDKEQIVNYVSDIHLEHKFQVNHCKTKEDCIYVMRKIYDNFNNKLYYKYINLICGDTANDSILFEQFFKSFPKNNRTKTFITLGNHELWNFKNMKIEEIILFYKNLITNKKMHFVYNNLFLLKKDNVEEITESRLKTMSPKELREETREASLIIFGGIGFAGLNDTFNAEKCDIYRGVITREEEINLSKEFEMLYNKVAKILFDKNVIVLTHMPMEDWSTSCVRVDGFVYVSGHNHRNYYYDDGKKRIYSDNQIGYNRKEVFLKQFSISYEYDWFSDYNDGVYEINRENYINFYRGIKENITFNREYKKIYMLKREGIYMFLMLTNKNNLLILNGGSVKKISEHSIEYFFTNLCNYSKSIKMFLTKYDNYQKEIAKEIIKIGGSGNIHGCIIDIDYYNHLYINPFDGSIIPYFAYSIVDKYVYNNIKSLLKNECPELYNNYKKLINENGNSLIKINQNILVTSKKYVSDTKMYNISRIIKNLQFTIKHNVVKMWNDTIVTNCSEENGRLLISELIQ